MYLIVNDNLEYLQEGDHNRLGDRWTAVAFHNRAAVIDVASYRANHFGQTLGVVDADDGDTVVFVAEPRHVATSDTPLYFHTMGRAFRVTGMFLTDADANAHMERHPDQAVIGERNGFIVLADRHDQGAPIAEAG